MTPDELRALGEAATKGPWFWEGMGSHGYPQRIQANDDGLVLVAETFHGDVDTPPPDTQFIVTARNVWPELVAVVEAAERWAEVHRVPITDTDGPEAGPYMKADDELIAALDALHAKAQS